MALAELPEQPYGKQGAGRAVERPVGKPLWLLLCVEHGRRHPVLAIIPTTLPSDVAGKAPVGMG